MTVADQIKYWSETSHNLYELLSVSPRDFNEQDLKKEYKKKMLTFHPDKNKEVDTTEMFLEIQQAKAILLDQDLKYAYDVFGQTNFQQEETILKGLKHSKKMTEEERMNTYWHIVNNKRLFNSLVDNIPYYFAWMLAVVLMIDVSDYFPDSY